MRCTIADLQIEIHNRYPFSQLFYQNYLTDTASQAPDIEITISEEELEAQKETFFSDHPGFQKLANSHEDAKEAIYGYLETVVAHRTLGMQLARYDAFLLHASAICVDGKGICFCAKSGTGKTTHSRLWKEKFQDRFFFINGDKPIVRKVDGTFYLYGTPWAGKENYNRPCRVPLHAICILQRGKENEIHPITQDEIFFALMSQILHPEAEEDAMKTLDLLQEAIGACGRYLLHCTPDPEAAEVSSAMIL